MASYLKVVESLSWDTDPRGSDLEFVPIQDPFSLVQVNQPVRKDSHPSFA